VIALQSAQLLSVVDIDYGRSGVGEFDFVIISTITPQLVDSQF
jgi:hypothetical protein